MSKETGIIKIHNKEYKTVALRVNEFRQTHNIDLGITTELVEANDSVVIMRASIADKDGFVIGTGYAEEQRNSTMINKTSALENCETSAIGRALAACGYAGTEYASANEVENAIHQQKQPYTPQQKKAFKSFIDADDSLGLYLFSKRVEAEVYTVLFKEFISTAPMGEKGKKREEYGEFLASGEGVFFDIIKGLEDGDLSVVDENIEDCSETTVALLKSQLNAAQKKTFNEINGVGK